MTLARERVSTDKRNIPNENSTIITIPISIVHNISTYIEVLSLM